VTLDVLRESPVFQGLSEAALAQIAEICEEKQFEAGRVVFAENAPAQRCYVVLQGEVSTQFMRPVGDPVTVRTIGRGGFFGWQCLVGRQRYLARAVCETDTRVLAIKASDLSELLENDPRMAFRMMSTVARLVAFRLKSVKARLVAELGKSR